jgi:hypothetical protein
MRFSTVGSHIEELNQTWTAATVGSKGRAGLDLYIPEHRCPDGMLDAQFTVESPRVPRAFCAQCSRNLLKPCHPSAQAYKHLKH